MAGTRINTGTKTGTSNTPGTRLGPVIHREHTTRWQSKRSRTLGPGLVLIPGPSTEPRNIHSNLVTILDLKTEGWETENIPFEVGSRGLVTKRNKKSISDIFKKWNVKVKKSLLFKDISKISLLCSFALFQAHCQPDWQSPPLLHP